MTTHSGILVWKIPWTEQYSPWGFKELDTTEHTTKQTLILILRKKKMPLGTLGGKTGWKTEMEGN